MSHEVGSRTGVCDADAEFITGGPKRDTRRDRRGTSESSRRDAASLFAGRDALLEELDQARSGPQMRHCRPPMAGGQGPQRRCIDWCPAWNQRPDTHLALHPDQDFDANQGGSLGGDRLRDQAIFRARAARRRIPHRSDSRLVHRGAIQPSRRGVGNSGRRGRHADLTTWYRTVLMGVRWVMTRRWASARRASLGVLVIGVDGTVLAVAPRSLPRSRIEATQVL